MRQHAFEFEPGVGFSRGMVARTLGGRDLVARRDAGGLCMLGGWFVHGGLCMLGAKILPPEVETVNPGTGV